MEKKEYAAYRQEAIAWLNSSKRDFAKGLSILQRSGFKPIATSLVAKLGERKTFARKKLQALLYALCRLWANSQLAEEKTTLSVESIEESTTVEAIPMEGYSALVRRVIFEFYELMQHRRKVHGEACAIEDDEFDADARRNLLLNEVEAISERMDRLWAAKTAYEEHGTEPDAALFAPITEDKTAEEEDSSFMDMPIEELKKLRKNEQIKRTRTANMLDYSQETKLPEKNPLPPSPARVKYEKKLEALVKKIELLDYRIAELS